MNGPVTFAFLTPLALQTQCCPSTATRSSATFHRPDRKQLHHDDAATRDGGDGDDVVAVTSSSPPLPPKAVTYPKRQQIAVRCVDHLRWAHRTSQFTVERGDTWAALYEAVLMWLSTSEPILLYSVSPETLWVGEVLDRNGVVPSGVVPCVVGCQLVAPRSVPRPLTEGQLDGVAELREEWQVCYSFVRVCEDSFELAHVPVVISYDSADDESQIKHLAATVLCPSAEARHDVLASSLYSVLYDADGTVQLCPFLDKAQSRPVTSSFNGILRVIAIVHSSLTAGTPVRASVLIDATVILEIEGHVAEMRQTSQGLWVYDIRERIRGVLIECVPRCCIRPL